MTRGASARYDFRLSRNNLAGLMVACAAGWAVLALGALHRAPWDDPPSPAQGQRARAAEEQIDPNTATAASLRRLPGIGGELAARIVDFRRGKKNPFKTISDLTQVRGIGEVKAKNMKPYLQGLK